MIAKIYALIRVQNVVRGSSCICNSHAVKKEVIVCDGSFEYKIR
jgi:hypothetical protein